MKPARLFHRTTLEAAKAILAEGFRDRARAYLSTMEARGVWLSEDPELGNQELPEGTLLKVDFDVALSALDDFEWIEEGKPYREWLVPADFIREHARVSLADEAEAP